MLKKALKSGYTKFRKLKHANAIDKILNEIDSDPDVILIGSPLHGNIGDHAISIAEVELLKKTNKKIIEIPGEYFNLFKDKIKEKVKISDTVVITGGGFIGTLWKNEEEMVRNIILSFPDNKVIIMPQTVYFENSDDGRNELEKSRKIYGGHNDLHMFVREEKSYDFCIDNFKNIKEIKLVPDIVTYLDFKEPKMEREGALFCLRQDKEKVLDTQIIDDLISLFEKKNINIKYTTTVIKERIVLDKRDKVFWDKLNEFKTSKIVITDRLHGMIFAAITATPCIAFDNLSGKVKGVYKWLSNLNYITILDNDSKNSYLEKVEELLNLIDCVYDKSKIDEALKNIIDII